MFKLPFSFGLHTMSRNESVVCSPFCQVGCFEIFKFCASGLGKSMMLYGIFPLALNIGPLAASLVRTEFWEGFGATSLALNDGDGWHMDQDFLCH